MTTVPDTAPYADNASLGEQNGYAERSRFHSILRRHFEARGTERSSLRSNIVEYLKFSPQSTALIDDLIIFCIADPSPDRLDVAIDVLSCLGRTIYNYAYRFWIDDMKNWGHLYPERAFQPTDDYWYILLRSVAQADLDDDTKLSLVSMCCGATSRGVLEGVIEACGDIGIVSKIHLETFRDHKDPFIAELATEVLNQYLVTNRCG